MATISRLHISTCQELNTMSILTMEDLNTRCEYICESIQDSLRSHHIPYLITNFFIFCSKTSTSGTIWVEGRSCNLSTRYLEAKRFEHTSKEISENRNWIQEWAYQMMSKWTTPQLSLIPQHSLIPIHTSIMNDTWSNWLKSDVSSRGSVRIRRTLLFRADPDMISKFGNSAFSLAKPINQLTFLPKRLLPSTILSVYQTPLRWATSEGTMIVRSRSRC